MRRRQDSQDRVTEESVEILDKVGEVMREKVKVTKKNNFMKFLADGGKLNESEIKRLSVTPKGLSVEKVLNEDFQDGRAERRARV